MNESRGTFTETLSRTDHELRNLQAFFLARFHKCYDRICRVFYNPFCQKMFRAGERPEHFLPHDEVEMYRNLGKDYEHFEKRFAETMRDLLPFLGLAHASMWTVVEESMQTRIKPRKRRFRLPLSMFSAELVWCSIPTSHGYRYLPKEFVEFFGMRVVSPFGCCVFPDLVVSAVINLESKLEEDWTLRHLALREQHDVQVILVELIKRINNSSPQCRRLVA